MLQYVNHATMKWFLLEYTAGTFKRRNICHDVANINIIHMGIVTLLVQDLFPGS